MNKKLEIKKINSILTSFGLVLLLLLSPCKVRNFIQAELGVPQTNVLNKSQSTISPSNCQTYEISETIQTISKTNIQQSYFPISEANSFEFKFDFPKHSATQSLSKRPLVTDIPLYILYQNLQVYS